MRILFIGNCQVGVYKYVCEQQQELFVEACEVWNTPREHWQQTFDRINTFDYVITQPLGLTYSPLDTGNLRQHISDLFVIHNIYFTGLHPDCKIIDTWGPLGDCHSHIIFNSWRKNITKRDCLSLLQDMKKSQITRVFDESLSELKRRESEVSIAVTDLLLEHLKVTPVLWIFNHPTVYFATLYLNLIFNTIGLQKLQFIPPLKDPFAVASQWPIYPQVKAALDLKYSSPLLYSSGTGGTSFLPAEFIDACYRHYDANRQTLLTIQL